mmetsp:Transcript_17226/g.21753  ORF Transcript_17226/g.21753 Transcript_17226/m.21753 type:complete len:110 (-) Transcript_17226:449-778(-)
MVRSISIIAIWHKAKDPTVQQLKVEIFFGAWVFLAEACWIIYGNSFIYDDEYKNCKFPSRYAAFTAQTERTTVMVLVIYGYLLLAGITATIIFFIIFYFGYKSYIKGDL